MERQYSGFYFTEGIERVLTAHRIDVYGLRNPVWRQEGDLFLPEGEKELISSIDLGVEAARFCKDFYAKHPERGLGFDDTIDNKHLSVVVMHRGGEGFSYNCSIKKSTITYKKPKEFVVTEYCLVNGQVVSEKTHLAKSIFKLDRHEKKKCRDMNCVDAK